MYAQKYLNLNIFYLFFVLYSNTNYLHNYTIKKINNTVIIWLEWYERELAYWPHLINIFENLI